MSQDTLTDAVAALFRSRPHEWIDARELMTVGGNCAWRSRVSNARTQQRMRIDNRWEVMTRPDGSTYRVSYYRYVPETLLEVAA